MESSNTKNKNNSDNDNNKYIKNNSINIINTNSSISMTFSSDDSDDKYSDSSNLDSSDDSVIIPSDSYYLCSKSDCTKCPNSGYYSTYTSDTSDTSDTMDTTNTTDMDTSDTTNTSDSSGKYYSCTDSKCKKKKYSSNKNRTRTRRSGRLGRSGKNHSDHCSNSCKEKNCKYCKIFGISPKYLGVHFMVANDIQTNKIQSNHASFQDLMVDGYQVSPYSIKKRETKRLNINDAIDNRCFYLCNTNCEESINKLTYKCNQILPKGGLVRSICVSGCNIISESLQDVICKPTFRNKGAPDTQVEVSLVVAKVDKYNNNGIRYAIYKTLDKTIGIIPRNKDSTVNIVWKGPLPLPYMKPEKKSNIYLWFMINIITDTDNKSLIDIVDTDTPDITIVW